MLLKIIKEKALNDAEKYYNDNKDMFKEHSLFLMKEHCKLFSSYSNKAKELLNVLNQL